ncbi:hypothetical protein P153DRAFT_362544 [Dothidotthia symphoricarpi CBS 119687]|uniref:Complex I intermediate-associated protein-like protein 84 n=1 Tax=Dothidotthia symphoricarpi CBS 119687 TaxID=1392245 RepID=A0A6A6AS47_9PLEO|nr:uncharacterized protein P153DRAFT_362544 [Dothidotthia symphoricarpi CBS 119687]KAF2134812.1 hypothetical protein P153DRAFT_362544 [Dothidotthia symphoricarpi CBS 119687]
MSSHLTRVVFRSIIANEPLLYRGCRLRARPSTIPHHGMRALPQVQQRRTFLKNLAIFKQQRKLKPMEMPPGLDKLSDLAHAQGTAVRPPPAKDIAAAIKAFFAQRKGTFEQFHILLADTAFKHLMDNPQESGEPWFTEKELLSDIFRRGLLKAKQPDSDVQNHIDFGLSVLAEVTRIRGLEKGEQEKTSVELEKVQLLSRYGAATKARDIAVEGHKFDANATVAQKAFSKNIWKTMLLGIAREGNVEEMLKTVELLQECFVPLVPSMRRTLVNFFAEHNDLERAKHWYSQPVYRKEGSEDSDSHDGAHIALLKACALSGDLTFGHQVVASLLKGAMPNKEAWDAIFLWSTAIGKGVDEVDRMMTVMIRRNDEARQKDPSLPPMEPDIETINALVEFSMSRQDPYSAERYIVLGEKRGIEPNEKTFTMQMQYRLSVKDIDGARAAYYNLQGNFAGSEESVAVINRLVQALCQSKQHHFDDIMAIVDDLHERKAHFEPETVGVLCVLHLRRNEVVDAQDLLQVHAHQYSPPQRSIIRKALQAFLMDGETSTADAWDTYQILRNVFSETTRDDRIPIMNEFFARERSDMACHVFFHMRNHVGRLQVANRDVYVAAFTGFARCADAESLELAHNQLKLDLNVDMDTRLRNSLMLAYGATGNNKKALQFWREICESKEGPSYNSISIAFRSCEGMPWGDEHAKSIWARLKEQDVEIDKNIWTAYMSAISRNHLHDEAQALVETVEDEYGFTPDLAILGSWFNTTTNIERQGQVEEWIKQRYPDVWKEMDALGHWVTMDGFGYRQYNINRNLDP